MSKTSKTDFGAGLLELEQIANWFESSDIDLEAGLGKFERGMELVLELKQQLQTLENRVEKIQARFDKSED